ncbi:tenascin-X-like [Simochromis diagramma]|uniref:tenascin-X-like n=1 Tax=Simochromis diagramma TaxID=43689 RepID=UPI001A7EAA8D|nr:tenascin-X-like [Simochromis diagramma]
MKLLSLISDHLLLCVFLSLLWGTTDSTTTITSTVTTTVTAGQRSTAKTTQTFTPLAQTNPTPQTSTEQTTTSTSTTAKAPPDNVARVDVTTQNENSITLTWNKVNNIPTYILQYGNITEGINKTEEGPIVHVVRSLIAGTNYTFTLFTISDGLNSSGYRFSAVTAPRNADEFKAVGQNETSIKLQWKTVSNSDSYILLFNEREINISNSTEEYRVSDLTSGTRYNFTLFTVFGNVRSSGVNCIAVTAPQRVNNVTVVHQNETSITLQWEKVKNIPEYILQYNNSTDMEKNISVSEKGPIIYEVSPLTAMTKYNFTLITVFEGVSSTGYSFAAVTAPDNVDRVNVTQNESSITLTWNKVNNIPTYILQYGNITEGINKTEEGPIVHVVNSLIAGTNYTFTLFTAPDGLNSSGYRFSAVTAPRNADEFKEIGQNETSITLEWKTVPNIDNYILVFNEREINISNSTEEYRVLNLTSGTRYNFTLFTVFGNVRSSGVNCIAVTAPQRVNNVTVVHQNETSITLQWEKVKNIPEYILQYNNSTDMEKNISVSEKGPIIYEVSPLTAMTKYNFTLITVFEGVSSTGYSFAAVTAPDNVDRVNVTQNESSITLTWNKVNNIPTYILQYGNITEGINKTEEGPIVHVVNSLIAGTNYTFTLFTAPDGLNSSGYRFSAVTAPRNADEFKEIGQNETSITLEWKTVPNIDNYILVFNEREINISNSTEEYRVLNLTSGTRYNFTLFTVFGNVRSSGVNCIAVTAPQRVNNVTVVHQNETSITLQWEKVKNIPEYILQYNNSTDMEKNISVSEKGPIIYEVSPLTAMTKYNFTLITVFEGVSSTGYSFAAVTAPDNVDRVNVTQNESSITLTWNKVNNIPTYILQYGNITEGINKTEEGPIVHVVNSLIAGTNYTFTLFTAPDGLNSSGYRFSAVTAPRNADEFKEIGQNETSITLEWKTVPNIDNYILVFNEREINISNSTEEYRVLNLTSGTRYNFTLFTVFGNVRSSGVNCIAVTAPRNADEFKKNGQNETSITLGWKTVPNIDNYILAFNEREINISNSEKEYRVLNLTSGTRYNFTLFTVFGNVRSSGVNCIAVTAPQRVNNVTVVHQNETSITLQWEKVKNIPEYILQYNNSTDMEKNISVSEKGPIIYEVSPLTAMTKYNFTLITVFEGVSSTGYSFAAVTAPDNVDRVNVTQNESSITLTWNKVNNIPTYILQYGNITEGINKTEEGPIVHVVNSLTAGANYTFTLFTASDGLNSSGYRFSAVTAPRNADEFKEIGQNETSITLEWKTVPNIDNYILVFNEREINISNSTEEYRVLNLTSGTRYTFTLFTVFGNVRSSGVNCIAVTAPRNADDFKKNGQDETSITLEWKTVPNINNYILVFNEREINISNSTEEYRVLDLTSGTRYTFTLFTVFGNVRSSGVNCIAVTAPRNADKFKKNGQDETSITLGWKTVPNIDNYLLVFNEREININNSTEEYRVSDLTSGTRYTFTLFTVFGNVRSSGVNCIAVTVPPVVPWVSVTERFANSITLEWENMNKAWQYELQINGDVSDRSSDTIKKVVTSLHPGTQYDFSLTTVFAGLRSTPYTNFTVTAIDCASADWKVTNSSIKAKIEGLFSTATAHNGSNIHVSDGRENVSFTGLYPGATYNISLVYEKSSRVFLQCEHKLTIFPPNLNAHCEYWAAGYSVLIKWTVPEGEWTNAEVNVAGKTHTVASPETEIIIDGFQPANKYKVSVTSLSGVRSSEPHVFYCQTDPRGSFVLRLFRHLVVFSPYCFSTGLLLSIYWSRKMTNNPAVSMEMTKCDGGGDELYEDYDDVTVLGTEHNF